MSVKVKLEDVIDAMGSQFAGSTSLLNIKTGEVVFIEDEYLRKAEEEEPDDRNGLIGEEMELAYDIIENEDNYHSLPTSFDINEYRMMENFCFTVANKEKRNILLRAIKGKGAFRRFKDTAMDLGVIEDWYTYRDERYKEIAIEFCEGLGLECVE